MSMQLHAGSTAVADERASAGCNRYFGGDSSLDGCALGPVVDLGLADGEPLGLPRSGPLPEPRPTVPSRTPGLVIPLLFDVTP